MVWVWYALIVLVIFGLAVAFSRKGMRIKTDAETKPPPQVGDNSIL
jgi:heme/copper-type cytochrome/quinol oxidase subunit 2